ncbi:transcription factor HES-4-like [Amphibalanus amphitrite]|uniref:transcription factor HES-4-like n=1 Tax=Amphibalanus amphitrite TaxID=1232801 RepID=UPI001C913BE1|nr:transcription factor HES-4-like [Amphibalanus amphitrite]XP_043222903.1 transcription factor HES-4-like [Amphibalanus amphitrite]
MPSDEKASEHRRINKPIMEKRRRARINDSLSQLKSLVLEGLKKDPARHSKLEKADILEMAVKHLRSLQARPERAAARYREGYVECRREVAAYLSRDAGLDSGLRQRLLSHLGAAGGGAVDGGTGDAAPALSPVPAISAGLGSLQLLPATLPGGQIAFLLPGALPGTVTEMVTSPTAAAEQPPPVPAPQAGQRSLSVCTEPAAASVGGSEASSCSVGSASPAPSWDPAETRCSPSPCSSERSFGSCAGRADSPQPLDLVAHNRHHDEEAHWRPW